MTDDVRSRLLEAIPEAALVADARGRILRANSSAARLFGYAEDGLVGLSVDSLVPPASRTPHAKLRRRFLETPQAQAMSTRTDITACRKDGAEFPADILLSPLDASGGRVLAVVRDATERRRAELTLSDMAQAFSGLTGEAFFRRLVTYLTSSLKVDCAFVGCLEGTDDSTVRTIAVAVDSEIVANFEYPLPGSPCESVIGRDPCYVSGVRGRFPGDGLLVEMDVEDYCGVPLISSSQEPLGILVVMSRAPLLAPDLVVSVVQIFGARAAAEIERLRAERDLRRSEERYRSLFEQASDAIFLTGADGRYQDVNTAACRLLGRSREELLRLTHQEVTFSEDLERHAPDFEELRAGNAVLSERRLVKKDGAQVAVEINARMLPDGSLQGIARDITERKRAEEELTSRAAQQEAVARLGQRALSGASVPELFDEAASLLAETLRAEYAGILEVLPDGESVVIRAAAGEGPGDVGRVVPASPGTHAGFSLRSSGPIIIDDLPSEKRFRPSPVLVARGVRSGLAVAMGTGRPPLGYVAAYTLEPRRFSRHDVYFLQGLAAILGAAIERDGAIRALSASEEKYRVLFESASDVMYTVDILGRLTSVNAAAEALLGCTREELLGRSFRDLVIPEDVARVEEVMALQRAGQGGEAPFEISIVSRSGRRLLVEASSRLVRDREGRPAGFHGVARNITERKSFEEQTRQSEKMEALGRLAGGIAHDFNNLLTAILGYGSLALNRLGPAQRGRRELEEMSAAAERAASLTRQLLTFSRKQPAVEQVVDLNEALAELLGLLRPLIPEDIRLRTVSGPRVRPVTGDPGQLQQVILNLALNARDAMPNGGVLTIETRNAGVDELPPTWRGRAFVVVSVGDTGVGMTAETKARIFEPFFTTKDEGKGTGLGLATVYRIVEHGGGSIRVESSPGAGTTFHVYLPAARELGERAQGESAGSLGGTETVLLVEDNGALRHLAREILEAAGYRILEAEAGPQALDLAAAHEGLIHLLVTDVVMPGMAGNDLAARLTSARPGLKVVFMSGYTGDAISHHGPLDPAVPFLQKPFPPLALLRAVARALGR